MPPLPDLRALPGATGLSPPQLDQLENYLTLLLKWNGRMNLTAVRTPEEIVARHFSECLFAARQVPADVKTLLDYGSGAGLPGIPIAVCRPEIAVTLAESQNKKAAFLREAVRALALDAEVWPGRVEAMPPGRVFDAVTLRAVDRMPEACRMAVQRIGPGGWIGIFATHKTEAAIEAIAEIRWAAPLPIPGSEQEILATGLRV
jgi:16S rRNA (guanine527-N7)-methyltransferase